MMREVFLGLLATGLICTQAYASHDAAHLPDPGLASSVLSAEGGAVPTVTQTQPAVAGKSAKRANFEQTNASKEARHVANWVVDSGDNLNKPFVIVDKLEARVFVFDAKGQLRGESSALLGLARGDHSVPGIGTKKLSTIRPEERTTPAGRFVANLDKNLKGDEMLWVDYDTAISMHRVVTGNAKERRAERLASSLPSERRISYGCINVPVKFYENVVSPAFTGTDGIVYVLPETRSAREVFGSYDVGERVRLQAASQSHPILPEAHGFR
ncbi:L,D-transpeptidase [Polaromonas sp. CG_9.11]|uniref:L,D-transpeptidase n=1 Tax=Polaromonas sp. CG_9.11 TaxID=2787730 RepID=UPI0018C9FAA0|nr:L,D-transpeptidase [Polaromonas sp. CG_9.11]MBG6076719.1 hypothetical protein [Polaromonas sp. CG_9.11]